MTTNPPQLTDPKRPSRAYIADVLLSEDIQPSQPNIEDCLYGWLLAVADKNRLSVAASIQRAFDYGDPESIGYCTYTYGYGMENTPQQERML